MEKGTQLTAQLSVGKKVVLGLQHVLAMFGATVLVPLLTGAGSFDCHFGRGHWNTDLPCSDEGEGTCFFRIQLCLYYGYYIDAGWVRHRGRENRHYRSRFNLCAGGGVD